jgi:hypothetical protein
MVKVTIPNISAKDSRKISLKNFEQEIVLTENPDKMSYDFSNST